MTGQTLQFGWSRLRLKLFGADPMVPLICCGVKAGVAHASLPSWWGVPKHAGDEIIDLECEVFAFAVVMVEIRKTDTVV